MTSARDFAAGIPDGSFRERCQFICEELRRVDARYDWVGMYWLDGGTLVLGPWSGRQPTEHTRIPLQEGICGAAVREARTIIVDDVQSDPRYLACFLETRSEIVVPIFCDGVVIGELDIDGTRVAAFGKADRVFLEELAAHIGNEWPGKW